MMRVKVLQSSDDVEWYGYSIFLHVMGWFLRVSEKSQKIFFSAKWLENQSQKSTKKRNEDEFMERNV